MSNIYRMSSAENLGELLPAHELLQAIIEENTSAVQEMLEDPTLSSTKVNWQDPLGWTPLVYAAFRGDYKLVKKLINRGAAVNHMALSRTGSGADGTTPLHACAAMRPAARASKEGFYETARVLMLAGGNPYQENLSGLTPIDVSAFRKNVHMKILLEGCALFKGTLSMPTQKLFGIKYSDRYCLVLPRFQWHPLGNQNGLLMRDGSPSLSLVCYNEPDDLKPLTSIPLDGARVVVESGSLSEEGFLIVKAARRAVKGVSVKSSTSSSCVIEVMAKASSTQTAGQVLQSLAEVCKSAAVAAYCGNLGQLCEASIVEALHNLGLADGLLPLPGFQPESGPAASQQQPTYDRDVIHEEGSVENGELLEEPKKPRKSLSLSRWGKAALRRLSIGDKPRRHSIAGDGGVGSEMLQETSSTSRARRKEAAQNEFARISEDTPEPGKLPPLPPQNKFGKQGAEKAQARAGRMSLQQDSTQSQEARRRSLQLRYNQGREILTSNQGISVDFWSGMRNEMMRRSVDGRRLSMASRTSTTPRQSSFAARPPVRGSLDVGGLDDFVESPAPASQPRSATSRASGVLEARRPEDSTMQDWVQQAAQQYDPESYEQWKKPPLVPEVERTATTMTAREASVESPSEKLLEKNSLPPRPVSQRRSLSARSALSDTTPSRAANGQNPAVGPSTPSPKTKHNPVAVSSEEEAVSKNGPGPKPAARQLRVTPDKGQGSQRPRRNLIPAAPPKEDSGGNPSGQRSRQPPVINLSNIGKVPANRSQGSKSSSQAPRPPRNSFCSDWFSTSSHEDDLFHWSLRPDSHRSQKAALAPQPAVVPVKPTVDPAVVRWAAEAAAQVKGDRQLVEVDGLQELLQAGWRETPPGPPPIDAAGPSPTHQHQPLQEAVSSRQGVSPEPQQTAVEDRTVFASQGGKPLPGADENENSDLSESPAAEKLHKVQKPLGVLKESDKNEFVPADSESDDGQEFHTPLKDLPGENGIHTVEIRS